MAKLPIVSFSNLTAKSAAKGTVVFLMRKDGKLPSSAARYDKSGQLTRAAKVGEFNGKAATSLTVIAPDGGPDRIVLAGCGEAAKGSEEDWLRIGGRIKATCGKAQAVTVIAEPAGKDPAFEPEQLARLAMGIKLRAYDFDDYKTKGDKPAKAARYAIASGITTAARSAWKGLDQVSDGVLLARDLVNQPANVLGTVEFAKRAQKLTALGVKVQVLGEKEMRAKKMAALLGVNRGSRRPPRLVVMRWNGGPAKAKPVAFIGKGVVFDTGGISIKPAGSMEDMKGDMGGAAAVTGLMHALAARKAKVNAIGIIGLVENMPDGDAQRPGDIVTSMSGQTIEIINTDAEGRLVLADALWYCHTQFKPQMMVNLATLTGAIVVALGHHHAGMFSNNDELAAALYKAGHVTGEKVWRMPLGSEYDKQIDSKNADMKNVGGRTAGSITAGQFLQRFVEDVPWAHLDVAGTAMGSPKNEYNQSWASGFGVRLLDRLVADHYEK